MTDSNSSFPSDEGPSMSPVDGPESSHPEPRGLSEATTQPSWRPMSGLAITAFVLSLILGLGSFGLWWVAALPLALGIWAIVAAVPERYRGRGFGIAAVVISCLMGACSFMTDAGTKEIASFYGKGPLDDLTADVDEEERDDRLAGWLSQEAVDEGRVADIKARFAMVEQEMGAFQGEVTAGTAFWPPWWTAFTGPQIQGVQIEEIGGDGRNVEFETAPSPSFWSVAKFEKGDVHIAATMAVTQQMSAEDQVAMQEQRRAKILSNIRFYVPKAP